MKYTIGKFTKINNVLIFIFSVIICFVIFSSVVWASEPDMAPKPELKNAVFTFNGTAYLYESRTGNIRLFSSELDMPVFVQSLSPDNTRLLYDLLMLEHANFESQLGVLDISGKVVRSIRLPDGYRGRDCWGLYWIDNDRFCYVMHINPDTSVCLVYDAITGEKLMYLAGSNFFPLPDGSGIVYEENCPHWRPSYVIFNHRLMLDEEVLYTVTEQECSITSITISSDGTQIAFIIGPNEESSHYFENLDIIIDYYRIVVADYNSETRALESIYETQLPEKIYRGKFLFDEDRNVCFVNNYDIPGKTIISTLHKESGEFITTQVDTVYDEEKLIKTKRLQEAIEKRFGYGAWEKTYRVTWIPAVTAYTANNIIGRFSYCIE